MQQNQQATSKKESMIKADIKADTLEQYYIKLCKLQTERHGIDYISVHKEIKSLIKGGCDSYTEFGIMQGTTLAAAMFAKPSSVQAVDIDLQWYNKANHLFEQYAELNEIDLSIIDGNSHDANINEVDLLYIDSVHVSTHLLGELSIHNEKVKKYIVLHDTTHKPELYRTAKVWCRSNPWNITKHDTRGVGYTVLQRETK